jgi:predicted transcriptional regulator
MDESQEKRVTLYVEMPLGLKERLVRLAKLRHRKITAEAILAVAQYVETEEAKEGIGDAAKPKEKGKGK